MASPDKKKKEEKIMLLKFENFKGYSSKLFDCEEWAQYATFAAGYDLAKSELLNNDKK